MPFVSIRLLEGHSQKRKNEISRRVTEAISEVAELPMDAIWVVIEDVPVPVPGRALPGGAGVSAGTG